MFILAKNWFELLKDEFEKDYYKNLTRKLETEYNTYKIFVLVFHIMFSLLKFLSLDIIISLFKIVVNNPQFPF